MAQSTSRLWGPKRGRAPIRYLLLACSWGAFLTPYKLFPLAPCPYGLTLPILGQDPVQGRCQFKITIVSFSMKIIIVLATVVAVALSIPADTYNPAYDSFNAQELVENVRLLKSYGNCFLERARCSPQGNDFKKVVPEAIKTDCAKCTPKQRELIRIVVRAFREKLPDVWADLVKKEDPKGEYKQSFERFLNGA